MGKKILKYAGIIVGAFLIFFIGAGIGSSGAKTELDNKKMDATQIQNKINSLKKDLSEQQDKNKEVFAMIDKKDKVEQELNDVQSKLSDAKEKLDDIQSQVNEKKDELTKLTGQVQKAKGQPKILQAGQYTVGKDIPEGRYKVTPVGEGSNFFVYDESGEAVVNTILGADEQPSYTFATSEGDVIQTEATVKLTPVE